MLNPSNNQQKNKLMIIESDREGRGPSDLYLEVMVRVRVGQSDDGFVVDVNQPLVCILDENANQQTHDDFMKAFHSSVMIPLSKKMHQLVDKIKDDRDAEDEPPQPMLTADIAEDTDLGNRPPLTPELAKSGPGDSE